MSTGIVVLALLLWLVPGCVLSTRHVPRIVQVPNTGIGIGHKAGTGKVSQPYSIAMGLLLHAIDTRMGGTYDC